MNIWSGIEICAAACVEFVKAGIKSTEFQQWVTTLPGMAVVILLSLVAVGVLWKAIRTSIKAGVVCVLVFTLLILVFPGVVSQILVLMQ